MKQRPGGNLSMKSKGKKNEMIKQKYSRKRKKILVWKKLKQSETVL